MRRKREVIKLELSGEQLYELERLWYVYGNHGKRHTLGNHLFIQSLFEQENDIRLLCAKRYYPTPECEADVEKVLANEFSTSHLNETQMAFRSSQIQTILAERHYYAVPRRTLERQ